MQILCIYTDIVVYIPQTRFIDMLGYDDTISFLTILPFLRKSAIKSPLEAQIFTLLSELKSLCYNHKKFSSAKSRNFSHKLPMLHLFCHHCQMRFLSVVAMLCMFLSWYRLTVERLLTSPICCETSTTRSKRQSKFH